MAGLKLGRNLEIVKLRLQGETIQDIAAAYGISLARVSSLIAAFYKRHGVDVKTVEQQSLARLDDHYRMLHPQAVAGSFKAHALCIKIAEAATKIVKGRVIQLGPDLPILDRQQILKGLNGCLNGD